MSYSDLKKQELNNYKNFSFAKHKDWKPKIIFCSIDLKKGCSEHLAIDPSGEKREIYNRFFKYYYFLAENFGLNGINNKGLIPRNYFDREEINATFCTPRSSCPEIPSQGDAPYVYFNNKLFDELTIAHEIAHGIINAFSPIHHVDNYESDALNESFADILSIAFTHWLNRENAKEKRWVAFYPTEELIPRLTLKLKDLITRDMSKTKTMPEFQRKEKWEHINSCIPSHAFYFICTQILHCPSYQLAKIWVDAVRNISKPDVNFTGFAKQTLVEASRFVWKDDKGNFKDVKEAVSKGWDQVGIKFEPKRNRFAS